MHFPPATPGLTIADKEKRGNGGDRRPWNRIPFPALKLLKQTWVERESMVLILLGALLFFAGLIFIFLQPLRGHLSRARSTGPSSQGKTLEPERPGRGFDLRSTWPGLATMGLGAALLLMAASGF
jgi:hypothetical protein